MNNKDLLLIIIIIYLRLMDWHCQIYAVLTAACLKTSETKSKRNLWEE